MDHQAVYSGLANLNPDLKVFVGILSLLLCIAFSRGAATLFVGAVMIWVTTARGKVSWSDYAHALAVPLTFLLLGNLALLVDASDVRQGWLDLPFFGTYLSITKASFMEVVKVSRNAGMGIACVYMIGFSTPMYEIVGVLRRWHLPGIMVELMYFIYRYLFVLLEAYRQMQSSAESRLGYLNLRCSYRSFLGICSNLLIVAFQKASQNFDAMEARNYEGHLRFLEKAKPIKREQIFVVGLYLLFLTGILFAERRWQ
ncbi:MAG: cobalt ECF transporter T component CbiQ [Hungatella sp.]